MLSVAVAQALVTASAIYLLLGLFVALGFVFNVAGRIDPSAAAGSLGFKLAILPGCVALWPVILVIWRRGRGLAQSDAHRDKAGASS